MCEVEECFQKCDERCIHRVQQLCSHDSDTSRGALLSRAFTQALPVSTFFSFFFFLRKVLSRCVNMNVFQGINIFGNELKLCQLIHNTLLKNAAEVSKVINIINNFSEVALMSIKHLFLGSCNFPGKLF